MTKILEKKNKTWWKSVKLSNEVEEEIRRFEENISKLRSGQMDPDDFRKFRLENGIYGIRNYTDKQMVRIKIHCGEITSDQLDAVADLAEDFTPIQLGHITTRQAIQIHKVPLENIPEVIRRVNASGLTTREACGNTVRAVTACPYAGVAKGEKFDVTPYARATAKYFLRNPVNQNLPRKFKFAFEGCEKDHAFTSIHDLAFIATIQNGVKGFRTYVGGGLGALPHVAELLESFTPASMLLPTAEAVLRIFDRANELRLDKSHARIKIIVKKWGIEEFRKKFEAERKVTLMTASGLRKWEIDETSEVVPPQAKNVSTVKPHPGFERWRNTNAFPQKQDGYSVVTVNCPLGDLNVQQMHDLATIARQFSGGKMRTTIEQNMVLRWVEDIHLPALHTELEKANLATPGAGRLSDITRCPGADTCQIAVTKSRELAIEMGKIMTNGLAQDADMEGIHVKISGCTNSCGHHHIGTVGFYGTYRKVNGHSVPHYQMLVGGSGQVGEARFGRPLLAFPARRVPDAFKHLVSLYKKGRKEGEDFGKYLARADMKELKTELRPFTQLPPYEENPKLYYEWGEDKEFKVEIGRGECAA